MPIGNILRMRDALVQPDCHDDKVQQQISHNQEYGDADGFPKTLQEDRAEQRQQPEGDGDFLALERLR
ncbi:MAG: hypothetical protein JOZ19_05375 [Rubrobacter sp.]|nr:hypothetical protein [Rubrobacter sp.]